MQARTVLVSDPDAQQKVAFAANQYLEVLGKLACLPFSSSTQHKFVFPRK